MIGLVKSHLNLSDYSQFIFKKGCEVNKKKQIYYSEKKNAGNYIYDYCHSFFGKDFYSNALHRCFMDM